MHRDQRAPSASLVERSRYGASSAQRRRGTAADSGVEPILPNTPYDGKFTFVRVRYGPPVGYASQRVFWSHDYPTGERNFMRILNELTYLGAARRGDQHPSSLDDPELFKYPARRTLRARAVLAR
mgnify:CR=1 FL=1